jgi:hypothetical protein
LHLYQQETRMKHRAGAVADKASAYVAATSKQASSKDAKEASKGNSTDTRPILTFEQRQARHKEIEDRKKETKCWKCGKKGHWSRECQEGEKKDDCKGKDKAEEASSNKQKSGSTYKAFVARFSCLQPRSTEVVSQTRPVRAPKLVPILKIRCISWK